MMVLKPSQLKTFTLFLLTGLAWGLGFLFIRIAVQGVSPLQYLFARLMISALVLSAIMVIGKRRWPRGAYTWLHLSVLGVFGMFMPSLLFGFAGERIPSALSAIYNSSVPILTVLITLFALKQERVNLRRVIAVSAGALGIVIVLSPWNVLKSEFDITGQLYALGAVVSMAFTYAYTKKYVTMLELHPVGVVVGQAIVAMVISAPLLFFADLADLALTPGIIASIITLGAVCSGISFVWNFQVIEQWGASSASMVTYLTTIVGVFAGVFFLHETLTFQHLLGAAVVLVAVAIGIKAGEKDGQKKR